MDHVPDDFDFTDLLDEKQQVRARRADVLLISEQPWWPIDQGSKLHGSEMAKALSRQGMKTRIASMHPTPVPRDRMLSSILTPWPDADGHDIKRMYAGWAGPGFRLRRKIASHQALDPLKLGGLLELVRQAQPKVVIAVGQHGPIMLQGLTSAYPQIKRIWYAADDPTWYHMTCWRHDPVSHWPSRAYATALYAALERAFVPSLDASVAVSPTDAKMLNRVGKARNVRVIRNGVDLSYFKPPSLPPMPRRLIFWGRLDFEPNVDAVCWFADKVWPGIRKLNADAKWRIVGRNPAERVLALSDRPGIRVVGPVRDLRPYAHHSATAILPMRVGSGIKNKLLEAAAMGMAIVASPAAVKGLSFDNQHPPVMIARDATDWGQTICDLWRTPRRAEFLRTAARHWVENNHTWDGAGAAMIKLLADLGLNARADRQVQQQVIPSKKKSLPRDERPASRRAA